MDKQIRNFGRYWTGGQLIMFWSSWMFRDRYFSNYATNWIDTKLTRKIRSELCNKSIVKIYTDNSFSRIINLIILFRYIGVYLLDCLSLSKNPFFSTWRREFNVYLYTCYTCLAFVVWCAVWCIALKYNSPWSLKRYFRLLSGYRTCREVVRVHEWSDV